MSEVFLFLDLDLPLPFYNNEDENKFKESLYQVVDT